MCFSWLVWKTDIKSDGENLSWAEPDLSPGERHRIASSRVFSDALSNLVSNVSSDWDSIPAASSSLKVEYGRCNLFLPWRLLCPCLKCVALLLPLSLPDSVALNPPARWLKSPFRVRDASLGTPKDHPWRVRRRRSPEVNSLPAMLPRWRWGF